MLYPTELRGRFNVAIPYTTEPMASSAFRARPDRSEPAMSIADQWREALGYLDWERDVS